MASRQKQLIDLLTRRGWDYETLSVTLGVRANTVSRWHNDTKTARQRHIEALEQLRSVPPPVDHGDDAERERRSPSSTSVASFNISTPRQRAAFLRRLLRDLEMSRSELAQSLHVGRRTVDNLLDSKYTGSDIVAIADALRYLIRHPPQGLHDRFHSAAKLIFGKHYSKGYTPGSPELRDILIWLADATRYNERTLRRYLPPYPKALTPPRALVVAFERAAASLKAPPAPVVVPLARARR
jgi:hypothetical protein